VACALAIVQANPGVAVIDKAAQTLGKNQKKTTAIENVCLQWLLVWAHVC